MSDEPVRELFSTRERWESVLQAGEAAVEMRDRLPRQGYSQRFPKKLEALHYASRTGATGVVASLLVSSTAALVDVRDAGGQRPLSYASQTGAYDAVKLLLADPRVHIDARNHEGRTPLSLAAGNGHAAVVVQLLARGANPNWQDVERASPLWYAAEGGHIQVVRLLL
jgi:ankyrin repeat protein